MRMLFPLSLLQHFPSLREAKLIILAFGLFSMSEFDFFDLDHRLQFSLSTRAHDTSLSLKPAVEPPLFVQTNQAKEFQPVSSIPLAATFESTAATKTTVNTPSYILH